MSIASLKARVRDIPDFPKKGILFRDITPLLKEPASFREIVARLTAAVRKSGAKVVVGIESRGFILARRLPPNSASDLFQSGKREASANQTGRLHTQYGQEILEIHADAVKRGQKVVVIDDLLATGGTAQAAAKLVEKLGGRSRCSRS